MSVTSLMTSLMTLPSNPSEAARYPSSLAMPPPCVGAIRAPTVLLRCGAPGTKRDGSVDFLGSPTDPALSKAFAPSVLLDEEVCEGLNHFIPMQRPVMVAGRVAEVYQAASSIGIRGATSRM